MNARRGFLVSLLTLSMALSACSGASFSGANDRKRDTKAPAASSVTTDPALPGAPASPTAEDAATPTAADATATPSATLALGCPAWKNNHAKTKALAAGPQTLTISGDFCLADNEIKREVVFIVDISASMGTSGGRNDPYKNGTCGRNEALRAYFKELKGAPVRVSVVTFSSDADVFMRSETIDAATAALDPDSVCAAVAATNYVAAFNTTQQLLDQLGDDAPVAFLISDGLPDGPRGIDHKARGLDAAEALRTAYPKLDLYALYLGTDDLASDAAAYLGQVTGSPDKVRLVGAAADLAGVLLDVPPPSFKAGDIKMTMTLPNGEAVAVTVATLKPSAAKDGSWTFTTEPVSFDNRQAGVGTLDLEY